MDFDPASTPQAGPSSQVNLIQGLRAVYVSAEWEGSNTSGLQPFGPHVLVRMDRAHDASMGGLYKTQVEIEKEDAGAESGCIYAIGSTAFAGYAPNDRPQVGDRVYIEKYAGVQAQGRDGHKYRIMDHTNVYAGLLPGEHDAMPQGVGR